MSKEIWKDIKDFEGYYQVSNLGNVRSLDREIVYKDGRVYKYKGVILRTTVAKIHGYKMVSLQKEGKVKTCTVHRLVAESFIRKDKDLNIVNHKDGNKLNNKVSNLEWCDKSYNAIHAYDNLDTPKSKGEGHYTNYLKENEVLDIYRLANEGVYYGTIADKYNTTIGTVSNIKLGKTWRRVTKHEK